MGLFDESDALHRRVQAFASQPGQGESFAELALDIARFQCERSSGFARLVARHAGRLSAVEEIPAVPVDAFRLTRMALYPSSWDAACFRTSGTTQVECGEHPMRRLDTYRMLSVAFGRRALSAALGPSANVVALAVDPGDPPTSSLGCMMRFFMEAFELSRGEPAAPRWLVGADGIRLDALERVARQSRTAGKPVLVLATAFALMALIDGGHDEARFRLNQGSLVMVTGGFKGRSRSVEPGALRRRVAALFGIEAARVVGEYGMTELTSQLWEATAPGSDLTGPPGIYVPPPWLQVTVVDPATLRPRPAGEVGVARFVDLGNIDSAVAILTDDLVRKIGSGVELLGRRPTSPARGCSLALETLLTSGQAGVA